MQPRLKQQERSAAQQQSPGADRSVIDDDLFRRVEAAKLTGEFVEIGAKKVGSQLLGREFQCHWKCDQFAGECELRGALGRSCCGHGGRIVWLKSGFAENRAYPGDRVKEVGCGVAFKRENFVPRKNVIAAAILREIGIADSPKPHRRGDIAAFGLRQFRGFGRHEDKCAIHGFGQKRL